MRTRLADLQSRRDRAITIELLDMYAREPMGAGKPLEADVRRRLESDLASLDSLFVVLAEDSDGAPLGIAFCLIGYSTFSARPAVNIHDLAVAPESRGKGVGRALLAAVANEARRRGCCKVTLEVRRDNETAQRLYRRFGFEPGPGETEMLFWTLPL